MTDALTDAMRGSSVVIAGGGLAGLVAGYELSRMGAEITLIEARRDRLGGRVWTRREFEAGQTAEAGGDLIDGSQEALLRLAQDLGCQPARILHGGFSYYTSTTRKVTAARRAWGRLADALEDHVESYKLAEQHWYGGVARELARRSVSDWLKTRRDPELERIAVGLRGFFLGDPEDLSLLALVDQFASDSPAGARLFRLRGGNDTLVNALARPLQERVRLGTTVVAVTHGVSRVRVRVRERNGALAELTADYALMALPATTLRDVEIDPPLPERQREAIARLPYGPATRVLAQFSRRFWRSPGWTRAFGTDLAVGAVWEGNEEQRGRAGILTFLAGGRASAQLQALVAADGVEGLPARLEWLAPGRATLLASQVVTWENDPWALGGYAVFRPSYDPELRTWLARPHGRVYFAGEHTSQRWQGYMNGAVESGQRVAREIAYAKFSDGATSQEALADRTS